MLTVDVEKQLGALKLSVQFEAAHGATALFGPSGAGKRIAKPKASPTAPASTSAVLCAASNPDHTMTTRNPSTIP